MAKDKSGLLIASLVAIVAVVALVMLLRGAPTGNAMVYEMSGNLGYRFDRPLGSESVGVYGTAENLECWQEGGQITCAQATTASPIAGRRV